MCVAFTVGNAELRRKILRIINRDIAILMYYFMRDISTDFPSFCTSPVKAPF